MAGQSAAGESTILFFNVPAHGHVNPTLPVVAELVSRRHRVIYYDAGSFRAEIERAGAEFRAYPGTGLTDAELARRSGNLVRVSLFLLEQSLRLLPFVVDELERERPDLVVFDALALWGMQAARLRRVRAAASISTLVHEGVPGLMTARDLVHAVRQALPLLPALFLRRRELVRRYGPDVFPRRSIFPCLGEANLVYTSRTFQPDTPFIDESFRFVGPSILPATRAPTDFPWHELDRGRPCIYVSLGTLYHGARGFYRSALAAFADHPAQVVLSIGREANREGLGPVPPNFIVRPRVPQLELLPKCDVFVTHGGMNSISEGLYFGVPLVVVPQQIEQAWNGRRVARTEAGVALADRPPYGRVEAEPLRAAVDRVLGNPAYADSARRVGESLRASGGYAEAASVLESALP